MYAAILKPAWPRAEAQCGLRRPARPACMLLSYALGDARWACLSIRSDTGLGETNRASRAASAT